VEEVAKQKLRQLEEEHGKLEEVLGFVEQGGKPRHGAAALIP
jgi:hypothetical protein